MEKATKSQQLGDKTTAGDKGFSNPGSSGINVNGGAGKRQKVDKGENPELQVALKTWAARVLVKVPPTGPVPKFRKEYAEAFAEVLDLFPILKSMQVKDAIAWR